METTEELKELLKYKEQEIESMKPIVDLYEQLKVSEIEECKRTAGNNWDDNFSMLSIPVLRKLKQYWKR